MEFWLQPCRDNRGAWVTTDRQSKVLTTTAWRETNIRYHIVALLSEVRPRKFYRNEYDFQTALMYLKAR